MYIYIYVYIYIYYIILYYIILYYIICICIYLLLLLYIVRDKVFMRPKKYSYEVFPGEVCPEMTMNVNYRKGKIEYYQK